MEATERSIIMSAPMVLAILAGRKTATRRVVKPQPPGHFEEPTLDDAGWCVYENNPPDILQRYPLRCPYGEPGDRLWVREAHRFVSRGWYKVAPNYQVVVRYGANDEIRGLQVDHDVYDRARGSIGRLRPSIHLPRWAARLVLELTDVRLERIGCMRAADVIAEGLEVAEVDYSVPDDPRTLEYERDVEARESFARYWDYLNADRGYPFANSPWVWALTFRRVDA